MDKNRIFVVEDELLLAQHLEEFLSSENFSVVGISDSTTDAFLSIIKAPPELLLLDVNLKNGDNGLNLAEAVGKILDIPVVFLTSSTDTDTLERIKHLNAYGFMLKPFNELQLKVVIELAISRHRRDKLKSTHFTTEDFFHYISHSLKGSLARVLGLTNLFKYEVRNEKALFFNELIEKNAKKIDELLTNYFYYITTVDIKKITFSPIFWQELLDEVLTEINFKEQNFQVSPSLTLVASKRFLSDPFLIKMIFTQLLKNSLYYKEATATVKINVVEQEELFQIKILDHGVGMDEYTLRKCFNLYYRGSSKSEGAGIGLNIAEKAVKRLNGSIRIVSATGKGTYVSILLPKLFKNFNKQEEAKMLNA